MVTFRLLTFNVLQLPVTGSGRRALLAGEAIEQADPDVIVLNEAFNRSSSRLVARLRESGYHGTPQVGHRAGWDSSSGRRGMVSRLIGGGIHVLSRFPIAAHYSHTYRSYQSATTDALSNKGAALVSLSLPDGRVWLAATHLQANERGNRHGVRMAQLAELRAFVSKTVPARLPLLIAGDLNIEYFAADQHGRPGQVGTDHLDANTVVGGQIQPDGPIHGATFDGSNPLTGRRYLHYSNVLDYVGHLNENGGRPRPAIVTETLTYQPGEEASDHFPVLAKVTL